MIHPTPAPGQVVPVWVAYYQHINTGECLYLHHSTSRVAARRAAGSMRRAGYKAACRLEYWTHDATA